MATVDLQRSIRQLLYSVTSADNGSKNNLLSMEDAIANLETSDENFHNYDLVQYVQGKIESVINPLVDTGLEKLSLLQGEEHDHVACITEDILMSPEYNDLCQSTVTEVKDAVDMLLDSDGAIDANDSNLGFTHTSLSGSSSRTQYYPLDDSVNSELSSLKDTGLMFIPQDQLISITEDLSLSKPTQVRLEALHQLQRFPPGDLPQCENWSTVSASLEDCLMADDSALSDSTLLLLSRMFDCVSSSTAKEVYRILVNGLVSYFKCPPVDCKDELDFSTDVNRKLLLRFRLLQHIQVELPSYWIRYNERVVEEIMNLTLLLLEMSYQSGLGHYVTPLHYLCVLDPCALWFQKWMHTQYSRIKVVESLRKTKRFLNGLLQHLFKHGFNKGTSQTHRDQSTISSKGLSYLHSLQALNIVSKLLLYSQGRHLVDTVLKDQPSVSTVGMFIHYLMNLLLNWPQNDKSCDSHVTRLSPTTVLSDLFSELAARDQLCSNLLCQDNVIDVILGHLKTTPTNESTGSRGALIDVIANTVAVLASTDNGRHYLLKCSSKRKQSVADVIAQFVVKALTDPSSKSWPSELVYSCLFVCRQLYNTADGVLALLPYGLHRHMAKRIQETAATDDSGVDKKTRLIDNLLNFAGTPKGIELLEESGLITECIQHMRYRYQLKLQVSQCEKFGYGFMVTQVASARTGILHLINSGYICDLVQDLWVLLNGTVACDDDVIRTHPFDPADRAMYKAIVNILNVVSSFSALWETLMVKAPPKTTPTEVLTIGDLLEVLVIKYGSSQNVINNEDTHLCGLRILSVLVTSLDSFVCLEKLFNLTSVLVSLQQFCLLKNNQYIIDGCSIERNRLLVAVNCLGGPNERSLPPHTLTQISDTYQWPFYVGGASIPSCYQLNVSYQHSKSLISAASCSNLSELRAVYINNLKQHDHFSTKDIGLLLYQTIALMDQVLPQINERSSVTSLSQEYSVMLSLVTRYSKHIGLIVSNDSLVSVLQKLDYLFTHGETSFDWFAVTAALILFQSHDQSCDIVRQFLRQFSTRLPSLYIWKLRMNLQPIPMISSGTNVWSHSLLVLHYIELIIQAELPLVYSAFRLSGYTPSQVCQDWLRQCFWNYLDWPEVCLYLINCTLMGIDYQVYFCVAVFKHLQSDILKACQEHNLLIFLKEEPLRGFNTSKYLSFMIGLEDKYRERVLKDMTQLYLT